MTSKAAAVVVIGVSGCGKSTVGRLLAERIGARFIEGDAFHPDANVLKMAAGVPLDDADRWPWLDRLRAELHAEPLNRPRVLARLRSAAKKRT